MKNKFIESCKNEDPDVVVQQYLIEGSSYFFDKFYPNTKEEYEFKKKIACALDVHIRDIAIVGSGKLGFSIKPDESHSELYSYYDFDHKINNKISETPSDIDVAIISSDLFDKQLKKLYHHTAGYKSGYENRNSFGKYILKGWLRPDFLPSQYAISDDIKDVLTELKQKHNRKINIGIYKSWFFFENYHKDSIYSIQLNSIAISK